MGTILCQNLQQDRKEVSDHCSGLDFKIEGPIMQFDGAVLSNAVGDSSGGYGKGDDKSLGIASNGGIDQLRDNDEPDMEWDALWRILSEPGPSLQTSQVPQQQVEDTMPQEMTVGGFQVRELEDHAYHTIPEELDIAGYEYNGFEGSNAPQDVAETGDLAGHIYEHNFLQPRATEDLYQYTNGRMVYHDYQEAGGTTLDLGSSAWTLEASGMQPGSYYEEEHESLHDQDYGSELSCSTTSAQKVACLDDDSDAETVNNTIDYERPRRSDGSVLASDCKTSSSSLDSKSKLAKSSIRNGTTSNSLKGTIIEIDSDSDEDFEDDEDCKVSLGPLHGKRKMPDWPLVSVKRLERPTTPAVMHLRAMEKTFLTPTQTISAHQLLGAGYGKGGGYNYEAIKHEKRTLPGSILDIKHGPPPPFGGNPPNGMVGEDKSLRTIVQRMLSGDEKEEACLEEGLMAVPLLKHQKIALAWMEKCEKRIECAGGILADDQGLGKTVSTIALILKVRAPINKFSEGNYASPESKVSAIDLDEEDDDYLSNTPTRKMIESIEPEMDEVKDEDLKLSSKRRPMAGTLVVCPTSVLRQWAHELRQKVTPAADLSILIYHGSNRTKDPDELARHDVVLTTYSIVTMEVPKQPLPDEKDEDRRSLDHYGLTIGKKTEDSKKGKMKGRNKIADDKNLLSDAAPLSRVSWFRVVLDEAQSIKNCRTQVARACWGLRAKRRWCLSGTPIQNAIDDLYSYFRFLRFDPLDAYKSFRAEIKEPIVRNPAVGYKKLQGVLQAIMLRRTKNCLIDGKPIVNLPARIVKLQQADFTDDEREFYSKLEAESRRKFEAYAEEGTLQSNYVNILWMLLRLRQACDHPLLVAEDKSEVMETHAVEFMKKLPASQQIHLQHILESNQAPCTICSDAPEEAVVSACGHVFCRQCISEKLAIGDDSTCPFPKCRVHLNQSSLYSLAALKGTATGNSKPAGKKKLALALRGQSWKTSSKIEAVMRIILSLPKISPDPNGSDGMGEGNITNEVRTEKAIVFSQWTSMLDLLETPLKCAGLSFRRLDGTMTVSDRDNAVSEFNTNPKVTVMIMSLKAASLGLNMVAACHVLLLDVWWNPTTEDQAIDRAHRIGQTRTVHVSRFTVKNTIEDRILALQEKKRQMVASAFGENGGDSQRSRLTTEDLRFLFSV